MWRRNYRNDRNIYRIWRKIYCGAVFEKRWKIQRRAAIHVVHRRENNELQHRRANHIGQKYSWRNQVSRRWSWILLYNRTVLSVTNRNSGRGSSRCVCNWDFVQVPRKLVLLTFCSCSSHTSKSSIFRIIFIHDDKLLLKKWFCIQAVAAVFHWVTFGYRMDLNLSGEIDRLLLSIS